MEELYRGCALQHGKYKIVKTLGRGSFGITYLATTKVALSGGLGKMEVTVNVAIKEFFMEEFNSRSRDGSSVDGTNASLVKNYRKKFHREAENLGKLKHLNIVKVLEVFDENNTTYYAMEYVDGESLDDYIKSKGRISEREVLSLLHEIGTALKHMHDNKMLHLDLKPKNIMRNKDGHLLLIDFGLSKQYDQNGEPESSTTLGLGTPGYAPIEQANYKQDGTFPATLDIYALGATVYKMLTGSTPPHASDILSEGFPEDLFTKLGISSETISMVEKAMSPIKKQRFQTVSELLRVIDSKTIQDGSSKNRGFGSYKKAVGESEYRMEDVINVEIDDPLPIPDSGISIALSNPAPGSLSYKFYLSADFCNTVTVFRNGKKILDEDFYGGIRPEIVDALKQNGFFSRTHWEKESTMTPLTGIRVECGFYYKNNEVFYRVVNHANPAYHHRLLDAVNSVIQVQELSQWINEALEKDFSYQQHDIKKYGISVVTIAPDYKLKIYYRGQVFAGDDICVGGLKSISDVSSAYERVKFGLQKMGEDRVDFETYVRNNKETIEAGYNITSYCSESDLLRLLMQKKHYNVPVGRVRQEMQFLPLCFDALEDADYAYEYQQLYCEASNGGGVIEIIQAGFANEKYEYMPEAHVKHLSNFDGFAYFLLGSLIQYSISKKKWQEDTVLLDVMPFAINAELWIQGRYRDGIKLIERNTTIPCKETETITDDNCTFVILFLGKRFSINFNGLFHYNPQSIDVTIDIDAFLNIRYIFRDKEMKKEISISQSELFNYEVKTNNEDTIWQA